MSYYAKIPLEFLPIITYATIGSGNRDNSRFSSYFLTLFQPFTHLFFVLTHFLLIRLIMPRHNAKKQYSNVWIIPYRNTAHNYSDKKKYQIIAIVINDKMTATVTRSGEIGASPPTRPVCPFTINR